MSKKSLHKSLRACSLFLCFLLLPAHLFAEQDATQRALDGIASRVQEFTLDNGLRVLFYKKEEAPIFSAQVWVKVGGVDEKAGSTGISHLFEHMAFKGTEKIGTKDFKKESLLLERFESIMLILREQPARALEFEGELKELESKLEQLWIDNEFSVQYQRRGAVGLNAATSKDYTYYTVALPSVAFEFWAWMESDRLLSPVFRQFYKELEVVKEERRSRTDDNPDGKMYEKLLATAYKVHPFGLPLIGSSEDLNKLTATRLQDFYKTYYRPDNILLVLVGDLDFSEVKKTLELYFSRLKKPNTPLPTVDVKEPEQSEQRQALVKFDAEPGFVLAYHKEIYPSPDDAHFAVLHNVLESGRSSLLYRKLVQERQLASSVYTSEAPGDRFPSLFLIGAEPQRGVSNARLKVEVEKILSELKSSEIGDEELAAAIRKLKVSFLNSLNSQAGLATQLASSELVYGNWRDIFLLYKQAFKTTKNDIKSLAQKYFLPSKTTYVHREK